MKKTTLLLILCILFFIGCEKAAQTNFIILSGSIENPVNDSITLYDKDYKFLKAIHLSDDNSFNDTLQIEKGYYYLTHGSWNDRKLIFLTPSLNLNVAFTNQDDILSISFQGKGKNENNYLENKIQFEKNLDKFKKRDYLKKIKVVRFLKLQDSLFNVRLNFLSSQNLLNIEFEQYETFDIEFKKSLSIQRYYRQIGFFEYGKGFNVPVSYKNPYNLEYIDNDKFLLHPEYIRYISEYLGYVKKFQLEESTYIARLSTLKSNIKSQLILDEKSYSIVKFGITKTKKLDSFYNEYLSIAKNEFYINNITTIYNTLKKLKKGLTSPLFEFHDLNNNLIKLKDLQGKLVYIDIWGTWCIPCVREIPALKKLEEEFRNEDIHFVSISVNDEKEKLKQFIKENDLKGIQLFTKEEDGEVFFEEYQVQGVPRFILIDREGRIIDAFADKPSNPNIRNLILENL